MNKGLLIVGSVAFDDVETPAGRRERSLGGSANYFSVAASRFAPVHLVAVVGQDFPQDHLDYLGAQGVDLSGLQKVEGETFFWKGVYGADFGDAKTLETKLNVFEHFSPQIPEAYHHLPYVFLGNIHPTLQSQVLDQIQKPKLVGVDTMNFWISGESAELAKLLKKIDLLVVNEGEARLLSNQKNIYDAVNHIKKMGPSIVVVKKGAHGAMLFHPDGVFAIPAYPLSHLVDPTGAGDSFAAGMMGYIAQHHQHDFKTFKHALIYGTVMASFACQGFSFDRVKEATATEIEERAVTLRKMISLD
jgi:sugar/nucleoside kinase (ribokinase family)